jgi:ribosomal-protein-alanine N-acetyltransferase
MAARFIVRRVRARDLDRILEIEHASFGKDAYDRKLFADFSDKCGDLFLVAVGANKLWGYIVTCARGDIAELVSVATHPDVRREGVASRLLESTLRRLRRRGIRRFSLMVRTTNRRARAFYEKYGFEKERLVRGYYREGTDGVRMVRLLEP